MLQVKPPLPLFLATLVAGGLGMAGPSLAQNAAAPNPALPAIAAPSLQVATRRPTELRAGPDSVARIVLRIPVPTRLTTLPGRFGPWVQVRTAQGIVGWLQALDLSADLARAPLETRPPPTVVSMAPIPGAVRSDRRLDTARTVGLAEAAAAARSASPDARGPAPASALAAGSAEAARAEPGPGLGQQRFQQAQTYRTESEEARKFAFLAELELVKLPTLGKLSTQAVAQDTPTQTAMAIMDVPADTSNLVRQLAEQGERLGAASEDRLGREFAEVLLADRPLQGDISLQYYVNQLGRWLSLESSRPDLPWAFAVLDDAAVKAYATPGGQVFLTKGLVNKLVTEAELAGVLAREIVRVADRQLLQVLARKASANPNASVAALGAEFYAPAPDGNTDLDNDIATDQAAVVLMTRTGFNPNGLVSAIQLTSPRGAGTTLLSSLLGQDAPTQRRLTQLKAFMGGRFDAYTRKPSLRIAQRLDQLNQAQGGATTAAAVPK